MKNNLILILKGIIIGIGKIIPGVSGALLAITLNVYDKGINAITHFFDDKKNNIKFIIFIGIGIGISIIFFSKIINYSITKYYLITMLLFIGLIIGGIPSIIKKVNKKDYFITIFSFLIIVLLIITNLENNYLLKNNFFDYIMFFLGGIVDAFGTVVPGISSTALLMILGIYNLVIESLSNLTNIRILFQNIKVLISFAIGLFMGLILFSLLIDYLLKRYQEKVYSFILGVTLASICLLIIKTFSVPFKVIELLIGLFFFLFGIKISIKLDK